MQEKAIKWIEQEVETYDQCISGEVYGYMIEDSEGNEEGGCWGYFGYDNKKSGLLESAQEEIDGMIKERIEEAIRDHTEQLEYMNTLQPIEVY